MSMPSVVPHLFLISHLSSAKTRQGLCYCNQQSKTFLSLLQNQGRGNTTQLLWSQYILMPQSNKQAAMCCVQTNNTRGDQRDFEKSNSRFPPPPPRVCRILLFIHKVLRSNYHCCCVRIYQGALTSALLIQRRNWPNLLDNWIFFPSQIQVLAGQDKEIWMGYCTMHFCKTHFYPRCIAPL